MEECEWLWTGSGTMEKTEWWMSRGGMFEIGRVKQCHTTYVITLVFIFM